MVEPTPNAAGLPVRGGAVLPDPLGYDVGVVAAAEAAEVGRAWGEQRRARIIQRRAIGLDVIWVDEALGPVEGALGEGFEFLDAGPSFHSDFV